MKLAIFSDIHGNGYAWQSFLGQIESYKPDKLIFLGDVFGYYYDQQAILDSMRKLPNLVCLMGNHDKNFLDLASGKIGLGELEKRYGHSYRHALATVSKDNMEWVASWPDIWRLPASGGLVGAMHGSPENKLNGRVYPDAVAADLAPYAPYAWLFLGHTHHKMSKIFGATRVINPGSLGQQRDGKGCSWIMFDSDAQKYSTHIVAYDRASLCRDIDRLDPGRDKLKEVLFREN